jgi:hypothetical protein
MKRRNFLIALGLVPPLAFVSCGKDEFPSTPTIITGKVVDENSMPAEGVKFRFSGFYLKGTSPIPTFGVDTETNKDGIYNVSYVVTNGEAEFLPKEDSKFNIYVWKNNQYIIASGVGSITLGETNTFNFQIRKR